MFCKTDVHFEKTSPCGSTNTNAHGDAFLLRPCVRGRYLFA